MNYIYLQVYSFVYGIWQPVYMPVAYIENDTIYPLVVYANQDTGPQNLNNQNVNQPEGVQDNNKVTEEEKEDKNQMEEDEFLQQFDQSSEDRLTPFQDAALQLETEKNKFLEQFKDCESNSESMKQKVNCEVLFNDKMKQLQIFAMIKVLTWILERNEFVCEYDEPNPPNIYLRSVVSRDGSIVFSYDYTKILRLDLFNEDENDRRAYVFAINRMLDEIGKLPGCEIIYKDDDGQSNYYNERKVLWIGYPELPINVETELFKAADGVE